MPPLYLGANQVDKCYLGTNEIDAGMLGADEFCSRGRIITVRMASSEDMVLPINDPATDIKINWGDGSAIEDHLGEIPPSHNYGTAGDFDITVTGNCPIWNFSSVSTTRDKVIGIKSWGDIGLTTAYQMFRGCSSLETITATDGHNLGHIADFESAWNGCTNLISFPFIDSSSGVNFESAWNANYLLTSFPLLDMSNAESVYAAWNGCFALLSFPAIDMPKVVTFKSAWRLCEALASFPYIDTSSGEDFTWTWQGCDLLESMPGLDLTSGTIFNGTWFGCGDMVCMLNVVIPNVTATANIFASCTSLVAPNSTEQAQIGAMTLKDWTNPSSCP